MSESKLLLAPGEQILIELEAELWASSSNPLSRFFGNAIKIINAILGTRRSGYLVVTNQRVIEVSQTKVCWCFNGAKHVKYVLPSSVKECGYLKEATFCGCCCQAYTFYYDAFTQRTAILLKGADELEAKKIVDTFYSVIDRANHVK
ncbi:MAG: hypothetical protein NC111_04545 [Bacteroides sp.]|nr:hypothetical protein [Bacteroides sp.]MCM1413072.1 hypothetical protein [Bacteroides sp.]MCM1471778.1 hypothetical protein [Bacteroides sp.]